MSRAFVKEPDGGAPAEDLPERQISEHPNYVTPAGLQKLEEEVGRLETRRLELLEQDDDPGDELTYVDRDLRYFTARLESAVLVDMERQPRRKVAFGAAVTVSQPGGKRQTFTIVGEDEAEPRQGTISYVSPLARRMIGRAVGDYVDVDGNEIEILAIA